MKPHLLEVLNTLHKSLKKEDYKAHIKNGELCIKLKDDDLADVIKVWTDAELPQVRNSSKSSSEKEGRVS